jgi:thiamine-phosphate pyrophosphorylase
VKAGLHHNNSPIKNRLRGLYAITDEKLIPEQKFSEALELALRGGASIIQYRDKTTDRKKRLQQASRLCELCQQYQALSIINDDIELAKAVSADGVHLGKDDMSLAKAQEQLGESAVIGISCYNDIELAINAQQHGASYVAFGAMFNSTTKPQAVIAGPDIVTQARKHIDIPVCCIGGIDTGNAQQLVQSGTDMIAVISTLFAADNIEQKAQKLAGSFY